MAKKAKRIDMPRDRTACDDDIKLVGDLRLKLQALETGMNTELAEVKARYEMDAAPIQEQLDMLEAGIEAFCDAYRPELTDGGKTKTVKFGNGEVSWRNRPAGVSFKRNTKKETIVAWLLAAEKKFMRFLRVEHKLNKEAMLDAPELAAEVPGVRISSAGEKFEIKPFGAELAAGQEAA
jgi:phage host-nuclease inhibitor protein Gam